jgi:GDPmannose 4,6-dehydratase
VIASHTSRFVCATKYATTPQSTTRPNRRPCQGQTIWPSRAVASIECGLQQKLFLGNLDALRDWGHARDFVGGMWLILQQDKPDDYVLATGEAHSVREFVEKAFAHVGRTIVWRGSGAEEKGIEKSTGRVLVEVDPRYFRPTEVDALLGDASKARAKLGWRHKTSFEKLVTDMVEADMVKVVEERERRSRHG